MKALFEQILDKVGAGYLKRESGSTGNPEEALALVLRLQQGKLGVYLFNGPKFVRQVEVSELAELLED